ncbi:hypothetical protein AURANDRAFT_67523 [Aureococcus anophagefferens]|uniref:Uncharacterized protein n=1 Tax=Aureococcus anophagefferens TaxID=44056 RepID=F0YLF5_AURAN|nr:hypothetical protein AURANDRAFT_67523 [Aureococcus anophagefferens]EGB04089.1 hypothetical protein AURANDRAFT_67523 [Aureococcus anophagefferens]|eukprot:XP_009041214.1 hypothetical protein AURANDRAFT_67523 [Aureococcus anophagefferens]
MLETQTSEVSSDQWDQRIGFLDDIFRSLHCMNSWHAQHKKINLADRKKYRIGLRLLPSFYSRDHRLSLLSPFYSTLRQYRVRNTAISPQVLSVSLHTQLLIQLLLLSHIITYLVSFLDILYPISIIPSCDLSAVLPTNNATDMNPCCKVATISAGLFFAFIFAMMIPANVAKFAKEIFRSGLRQGKISDKVSRRAAYDDTLLKMNYAGLFAAPSFSGIPCYMEPYMLAVGMDWPSRQNVFESPDIPMIAWTDCLLQVTPFAAVGLCARLLQCVPSECIFTDLLAPDLMTDPCVQLSNWTSCDCFIAGLPSFAWQGIPDKLNADEEIAVILRVYSQNGIHWLTAGLDYNGWMVDLAGAGIPGAVHNPAYIYNTPTTVFAKTWCVTTYTIKECWSVYIGEDLETPAHILAPVHSILIALAFLGADLLTFMGLFAVTASTTKSPEISTCDVKPAIERGKSEAFSRRGIWSAVGVGVALARRAEKIADLLDVVQAMRLRDILTGNTKHVIDEAALPPSPAALYYFLDDQDSQRGSKWNPKGVGRPRFNAFNRQVTELLRDPFVVANMLAALKMVSDRGPVVESAPDSGDPARAPRGRPPKRRLETEDPAMKLMQEQVERAEAKNAALEKEKAALAEELRDAEATAAAKADGISSVTLDAALKAIRDALDRAKLQSEQASRNIDLIVGVDSSDLSMAELGVLSKVGDLVHLSAEVLDAAVASAPGLAQQLDELVATPRAKPELALIKRRRVFLKLLEVAKVRRTKGGVENVLPRHAAVTAMATGATAASVETRRGCMGDTISFAETWRFLTVAGRLAKVAYPGLFPGRRVAFADDNAQWTRLWAQQRLEHFNSFETNPLLQSWFAIVWPLQTLPLEKTLRELGVRSKPFVEVRAADFDIDAHSQSWLAKELAVLSVDGGYGRDLLKRTLYKLVWRHDPGAFPPAVFKKPRWTDAYKYRPEGPLQLEEDWKKDDVKSLEVQLKNTQKVPEVAEARLQVLDWFGIGCGDPGKDWVICVGDYVLYRNGTNAAGMTVADLSRLQDKRVVRTTAQLVALEAAETAAATPLAGPTGDAAAASTTVSAQPAAATRSTAVPATSTAATVAATSTAVIANCQGQREQTCIKWARVRSSILGTYGDASLSMLPEEVLVPFGVIGGVAVVNDAVEYTQ